MQKYIGNQEERKKRSIDKKRKYGNAGNLKN